IPGCNLAFRKSRLEAIGGFDPQFRTAGDDVDVCWRLQERGWTLGFQPAAMVWHHRRNSLRTYWKQQIGYGRAEAMLERKWPEKYNGPGHVRWAGRMYGDGLTHALGWRRPQVYHGVWGGAPFQSLYQPASSLLSSLPQMPEWHLMTASLAGIAALSAVWRPFKLAVPLLVAAMVLPVAQAWLSAVRARFPDEPAPWSARLRRRLLTAALHLIQPLARLRGRLTEGLTPWRRRGTPRPAPLWPVTRAIWSERWEEQNQRLLRQARPCWLHLAGLFGIGLLASPIALLNPVPWKIVIDSVLGAKPLPSYLQPFLPMAATRSPAGALGVAIGLLLVVAGLSQLQARANKVVRKYVAD